MLPIIMKDYHQLKISTISDSSRIRVKDLCFSFNHIWAKLMYFRIRKDFERISKFFVTE